MKDLYAIWFSLYPLKGKFERNTNILRQSCFKLLVQRLKILIRINTYKSRA
jgi:hypothetical protein